MRWKTCWVESELFWAPQISFCYHTTNKPKRNIRKNMFLLLGCCRLFFGVFMWLESKFNFPNNLGFLTILSENLLAHKKVDLGAFPSGLLAWGFLKFSLGLLSLGLFEILSLWFKIWCNPNTFKIAHRTTESIHP